MTNPTPKKPRPRCSLCGGGNVCRFGGEGGEKVLRRDCPHSGEWMNVKLARQVLNTRIKVIGACLDYDKAADMLTEDQMEEFRSAMGILTKE